jgi:AcrR family transcriptional regulator
MSTAERRQNLKDALIDSAERVIASLGLDGLKARELAAEVGCAVGAIYNAVDDLDDLVLAVNARTLSALEQAVAGAIRAAPEQSRGPQRAIDRMIRMALAYLDFAAANMPRWRALFDHYLSKRRPVPDWYRAEQTRLFGFIEHPLRELRPGMQPAESLMLARSLFSAVHGIVVLGLEDKLGVVPLEALRAQVRMVVGAIGAGLLARDA